MSASLTTLAISLAFGAFGATALHVFFSGFKERWPSNYTSVANELEAHHRRSLPRYLLVRLSPPIFLAGASANFAVALDGSAGITAITTGVMHACTTDIRALWRRRRGSPPALIAYHSTSTVAVLFGAALGGLLSVKFRWIFPPATEMRDALWTGAIVAVLAGWYMQKTSNEPDADQSFAALRHDIGEKLWSDIPIIASANGADPYLIQAIVAAEATQRPRWIRRIERRVPWQGSYGVAQIKSNKKLTDTDSVELLAHAFAGTVPERSPTGHLVFIHRLENLLENHNSSPAFLSDVFKYLEEIAPRHIEHSNQMAQDGFPHLTVEGLRRVGGHLSIRGSWNGPKDALTVLVDDDLARSLDAEVGDSVYGRAWSDKIQRSSCRRSWKSELPLDAERATIIGEIDGQKHAIVIDLSYVYGH